MLPAPPPPPSDARRAAAPHDREALLAEIDRGSDAASLRWAVFHLASGFPIGPIEASLLLDLLRRTEDPALLQTVVWALGRSGDADVPPAIAQAAMASLEPDLRLEAVRAVAAIDAATSPGILREFLRADPDDRVRGQAASLLGLIHSSDPAAVADLGMAALTDPSSMVRSSAIDALSASRLPEAGVQLASVRDQGASEGEQARAAEHLDRARRIAEAGGADLTPIFQEPADPMTVGAEPSHR